MDEREIRLRCIEAAAKSPNSHVGGFAAGVLEDAQKWAEWVVNPDAKVVNPDAKVVKPKSAQDLM
jgi:hypothetical protein